jgi:uncharacterized protein YceH (UPF0502 family)
VETLHPAEVRVLGALLEKDITTPEYYPLTESALQNACNQKSSRDPVVSYDEATVTDALASLQHRGMVLRISGAGHRVEKYGHRLGEKLNLGRRELALLCVLMLRGAQTVGELRGRTERMHDFADMEEVERVLETLAAQEPDPLVAPVPRGRWVQLFGGPFEESAASAPSREVRTPLEARVEALEREVAELKQELESFRRQFE